jgi:hypothetical protein
MHDEAKFNFSASTDKTRSEVRLVIIEAIGDEKTIALAAEYEAVPPITTSANAIRELF